MSGDTKYFSGSNLVAAPPEAGGLLTLAYRTFGDSENPAVLMPSCYGGTLDDTLPFLYTSKDGTEAVLQGNFVIAYHMAAIFPDFVQHVVVLAGSARTSWHNWSFLEGPKAALLNSIDFNGGLYTKPAMRGTAAFGRVYSTWALSQEWFRQHSWEKLGYNSLEEYLHKEWEFKEDANNLLCMLATWQKGDISQFGPEEERGNLVNALGRIKAKVLVMPARTDMYFPPEDSQFEVQHLNNGRLRVIESIWGHLAGGGGGTKEDEEFIKKEVAEFLS
ncbi:AB hydrolase-1 domain-containing protein [Mycena indigotica]|uniref:AB hydrolase-1 domain-containing protein n=1 Tax=Mycena indigotica TaxID=2126181 RepID=A0A8H6TCH9_9AGAR|nr:AB hydrolase-1 domain-containing protein [Mycena indigotica]KAF7315173.1 AB hydrolase-1 domain-containing protein [Mycena indigotica]